ncbi:hypothetical protein ACGF0J_13620 [Nonomuraea sp. NPDC047897]|uniref:hypothetical protein n=1 Tax=Nonomuraea sp. NPDC047897 TaxID=3364346 RepID=UPI00371CA578
MYVAISAPADSVIEELMDVGLSVREARYEDVFECDTSTGIEIPVNDFFWRRVSQLDGDKENTLFILERWAHGLGGEKWYRISRSRMPGKFLTPSPHASITAFSGIDIFIVQPGRDAILEVCKRIVVSLDERPLLRVDNYFELDGELSVSSLDKFSEVHKLLACQSEPLAFFFHPGEQTSLPHVMGIVPDEDGRLRSI